MEGAILLLLFTAFLVFVVYRMDQNDRKERIMKELMKTHEASAIKSLIERGLDCGVRWESKQPIDIFPIEDNRKRKK